MKTWCMVSKRMILIIEILTLHNLTAVRLQQIKHRSRTMKQRTKA